MEQRVLAKRIFLTPKEASVLAETFGLDLSAQNIRIHSRRNGFGIKIGGRYYIRRVVFMRWIGRPDKDDEPWHGLFQKKPVRMDR